MTMRGRPLGTTRGFDIRNKKWAVAAILVMILRTHGASPTKAARLVWVLYVDLAKAGELLTITHAPDGGMTVEVKPIRAFRKGKRTYRFDLPLSGEAYFGADDFQRETRALLRDFTEKPVPQEQMVWFEQVSLAVMLAAFGQDENLRAAGWQDLRRLAPNAILPKYEPVEASIPSYVLQARIAGRSIQNRLKAPGGN